MKNRKTITVLGQKYIAIDRPGDPPHIQRFQSPTAELWNYDKTGSLYSQMGWKAESLDGRFATLFSSNEPIGAIESLEREVQAEIKRLQKVLASLRDANEEVA